MPFHVHLPQVLHLMYQLLYNILHDKAPTYINELIHIVCVQTLGPSQFWVSEAAFTVLLCSLVLWLCSPFVTEKKTFYTVVVLKRIFVHICCVLPCKLFMHTSSSRLTLHMKHTILHSTCIIPHLQCIPAFVSATWYP